MLIPNALALSHLLLQQTVHQGDMVIDGTVGNGHDTALLASLVGDCGQVIGFDIQKMAIKATANRLAEQHLAQQVTLHQLGHEHLGDFLSTTSTITAAVFNLGYLPNGDKTIITTGATTITAVTSILPHLSSTGVVILVIYTGHPGGQQEADMVMNYCQQLDQHEFSVTHTSYLNEIHCPPSLIVIQRKTISLDGGDVR